MSIKYREKKRSYVSAKRARLDTFRIFKIKFNKSEMMCIRKTYMLMDGLSKS